MKHKNLLKLMAVVMILAMAMTMLIACGPKPEEDTTDPEPTYTAKNAADDIANAIVKSLCVDSAPVGFQYGLVIPTDKGESKINLAGYLDTSKTGAANTKVYLDYMENEYRVFSLSADKDYIYFDSIDAKKKFPGFKLAEKLQEVALPGSSDIADGMIGSLPGLVFDLIMDLGEDAEFEHEEDGGCIYNTIYGSLKGLAPMLGGIVDGIIPGVGAKLTDLLSQVNLSLAAVITDEGVIDYVDLGITTDSKEITLTFESKLAADFNPFVTDRNDEDSKFLVPNSKDTRYVETNILNFVLDGNFAFNNAEDAKIANYAYELKVDINPFELLEYAVVKDAKGALAFDVTKLLDITDGGLYFNVYHDCVADGCAAKHLTAAKGSVFSVAYSPRDFGNTNLYMSFDLQSIVPAGLIDAAIKPETKAALLDTVNSLLPADKQIAEINDDLLRSLIPAGTETLTMDTKALMASVGAPVVTASEQAAGADMLVNYNPLRTIFKAFDFLAGITYTDTDDVRVEVQPLVAAVATAEQIINDELAKMDNKAVKTIMAFIKSKNDRVNVTNVLNTALLGADNVTINVKNAAYGVEALNEFNFKDAFDNINAGEAKPIDRIVKVEPVLNAKGNIQMTTDSGVKMYDAEGNFLPMSDKEWNAVLNSKRTVMVKYTTASGATAEVKANVVTMSGLNTAVLDKEQTVYVVIAPVDGIAPGNGHIAAHQFTTKLTVTSLVKDGAKYSIGTALKDSYKYGEAIAPDYTLTLTYKDNATKTYTVAPTANKNLVKGNVVNAVSNFKLGYDKFGYTQEVEVKVASAMTENSVEVKINAGEKYSFKNMTLKIDGKDVTVKGLDAFNAKTVSFKWNAAGEATRKVFKTEYVKVLGEDAFNGFSVIFDEAGTYEVTMNVVGGFAKTFKFVVALPGVPAEA